MVKQQKIAKDSLRALESLGDKYDKEKRELMARLKKEKEDIAFSYEKKISNLKSSNDNLNLKMQSIDETLEDFGILQKNYNEAVQIIEDQKREMHLVLRENDELKQRNAHLEEEVKDIQSMLHE